MCTPAITTPDCAFFIDVLRKNGVPASAIVGEFQSGHTRDNAFLSRQVVDEKGLVFRTALIVCKAFHARRCLMLYQLAFPRSLLQGLPGALLQHHQGKLVQRQRRASTGCWGSWPGAATSLWVT